MLKILFEKMKSWRALLLGSALCVLLASQVYLEVFIYPHLS